MPPLDLNNCFSLLGSVPLPPFLCFCPFLYLIAGRGLQVAYIFHSHYPPLPNTIYRNVFREGMMAQNHIQVIRENCTEPAIEFTGFGKAYVPQQELCNIYTASYGFNQGTIFPELDLPYEGLLPLPRRAAE